jgi:hypothetical protein
MKTISVVKSNLPLLLKSPLLIANGSSTMRLAGSPRPLRCGDSVAKGCWHEPQQILDAYISLIFIVHMIVKASKLAFSISRWGRRV